MGCLPIEKNYVTLPTCWPDSSALPTVNLMASEESAKEARILRMVKKVLTDIAKDTYTPPGLKHPLSTPTVQGIRECLALISARESELALKAGKPMTDRPRFVDEPQTSVVVPLDFSKSKKKKSKPKPEK